MQAVITNNNYIVMTITMEVRIGFHISIAGGISNSITNALGLGCNTFQIFSRNPRGWSAKSLKNKDAQDFKENITKSNKIKINSIFLHMPYLPNLSSPNRSVYEKSLNVLNEEVERCRLLSIPYLVVHLGSHQGKGTKTGIDQIVKAIESVLHKNKNNSKKNSDKVTLLLENSAGQKNSIGSKFEEIRSILDKISKYDRKYTGVCLDTCHAFAAGYDLRKENAIDESLDKFDKVIGIKEQLKLVHLNDSKDKLNSGRDRHEHIGLGKIGMQGFRVFLRRKSIISNVPLIMETPIDRTRDNSDNLRAVLKIMK
jgi:deoxyribonuclease-4